MGAETLPARSLYWTRTIFVPSPAASVHVLLGATACQADHCPPWFAIRIWKTPKPGAGSVAASVSLTEVLAVTGAPAATTIDPVGAHVSSRIVSRTAGATFPTASMYCTKTVFGPSPLDSVHACVAVGDTHPDHGPLSLRMRIR